MSKQTDNGRSEYLLREQLQDMQDELNNCRDALSKEKREADRYRTMYDHVVNSKGWKLVKPFRIVKYLFLSVKMYGIIHTISTLKDHTFSYDAISKAAFERSAIKKPQHTHIKENIKFSVVIPLYNTNRKLLAKTIESVLRQSYRNFELILADGSDDTHRDVEIIVRKYVAKDKRVIYKRLEKNLGISENTNAAVSLADGDYIVLCDHDDLIARDALLYNAYAINDSGAQVLYSDEDHVDEFGNHKNPLYKPDWSPDLLYSQMYVCHLFVVKRSLFEKIGGFDSKFDGSQDYDLMLRLSEQTSSIYHIPAVLYSWRETADSTAVNADAKPYAYEAGRAALDAHLKRKYGNDAAADYTEYHFVYEARFNNMKDEPIVSIIIPFKDYCDVTDCCVRSIIEKSSYKNFEIILLNNRSEKAETAEWIREIKSYDSRIRIVDADFEFNWSKLNNFGIAQAKGEVYIFLNNDTVVISKDWIEKLCENALRDDVGVVGAQLLYEDNTIQHAGIVVGMGGWADHVFKGMPPVHYGCPFISPEVSRNVLAVTGACMVVSKKTIEKIGEFDDRFIICGSDVELCLRAVKNGLLNVYNSRVRLHHVESKSRDSYIPDVDFKLSYECYAKYRENGDPYYNINLDNDSTTPMVKSAAQWRVMPNAGDDVRSAQDKYGISEIAIINGRRSQTGEKPRINLVVPSVDKKHVFGGILTALKFFEELAEKTGCDSRIIVTDAPVIKRTSVNLPGYEIVPYTSDSSKHKQIVAFNDGDGKTIPIRPNDVFMATAWWTAYNIAPALRWQAEEYGQEIKKLIYFIQDFEPGFYPWSSWYLLAQSTYCMDIPTIAIFNSKLLMDYFVQQKFSFAKSYYFDPTLNESLKKVLMESKDTHRRKKQILVYGRPSVSRNCFEVILPALRYFAERQPDIDEWTILAAGEQFNDIDLGNGAVLHSAGKLNLEGYASVMLETYASISLMASPHPSYPPLEMSTFGIKTITNCYGNKDLNSFNQNIISLKNCSIDAVGQKLIEICADYNEVSSSDTVELNPEYAGDNDVFRDIIEDIAKDII